MRVLAGDIGGTKTLLQIADIESGGREVLAEKRYASGVYDDFTAMLTEFLGETASAAGGVPAAACLGVAGPVDGEKARCTNLTWVLESGKLRDDTGISKVELINDFQAVGYGIETLGPEDVVTLQAGRAQAQGLRAIIGAGTGLGQGLIRWQSDHYEVFPSEGGHVDFGPTDALQVELLQYFMERFDHVSYERVVCGRGLVNIYNFLLDTGRGSESPATRAAMETGDPAAAISQAALAGSDDSAQRALDAFVRIYGAQAGNLALMAVATGGLYVAGGIAPKIIDKLRDGAFMEAFLNKGQMRSLVETVPVHVVVNPAVGLQGAACRASWLARG